MNSAGAFCTCWSPIISKVRCPFILGLPEVASTALPPLLFIVFVMFLLWDAVFVSYVFHSSSPMRSVLAFGFLFSLRVYYVPAHDFCNRETPWCIFSLHEQVHVIVAKASSAHFRRTNARVQCVYCYYWLNK